MNQTGTTQSNHPIMDTGNPNVTSILECTDCHNPHGDKDGQGHGMEQPTLEITGVYKDTETSADLMSNRHTECVDCHDPHALEQGNITVSPGDTLWFKCHTEF